MKVTKHVSIDYNRIFSGEPRPTIQELLATLPSKNVLELLGHFSAQIHTREKDPERQIKLLNMWRRLPSKYKQRLDEVIHEIRHYPDTKFVFISNISTLILMQHALANYNSMPRVDDLTAEQELNFLKAYLLSTDEWTSKQIYAGENGRTPDGLARLLIKLQFPYQEILELKDFRVQFVKAIHFFQFCEKDPVFKSFLEIFYKENRVTTWQEYLYNLLATYIRKLTADDVPSRLIVPDTDDNIQEFLRQFSVTTSVFPISDDFKGLREKPIFEYASNDFLFLSLNFFVDKFFQGIQFAMAAAVIKHGGSYKGSSIKSFSQFKSIYGEELSEKGVFYSVVNNIFSSPGIIKYTGEELKGKVGGGEPDYYVRVNEKVALLEYKDVLINAEVKHSYDFEKIKTELFKKFVENEKGAPKGVSQLINCIDKIRSGGYNSVDAINGASIEIYPVIVFTEFPLNIAGVNYLLNKEFRRLLSERGIDQSNIHDLTLIDLSDLALFQDLYQSGKVEFISSLDEFIATTKRVGSELATYTMRIRQLAGSFGNITPKILIDVAKGMLG